MIQIFCDTCKRKVWTHIQAYQLQFTTYCTRHLLALEGKTNREKLDRVPRRHGYRRCRSRRRVMSMKPAKVQKAQKKGR